MLENENIFIIQVTNDKGHTGIYNNMQEINLC